MIQNTHVSMDAYIHVHGSNLPMILSLIYGRKKIYGRDFCPIFLISYHIQKKACKKKTKNKTKGLSHSFKCTELTICTPLHFLFFTLDKFSHIRTQNRGTLLNASGIVSLHKMNSNAAES